MSYAGSLGTHCACTLIHSSQSSFQSVAHFVYESCRLLSHHSYSCLFQSVCCFALLCMNPAEVQVTILIHVCFDLLSLVLYMNPASVKSPFFVMFVSICYILGCVWIPPDNPITILLHDCFHLLLVVFESCRYLTHCFHSSLMFCNGYTTAIWQSCRCQMTLENWQIVGLNENLLKWWAKV